MRQNRPLMSAVGAFSVCALLGSCAAATDDATGSESNPTTVETVTTTPSTGLSGPTTTLGGPSTTDGPDWSDVVSPDDYEWFKRVPELEGISLTEARTQAERQGWRSFFVLTQSDYDDGFASDTVFKSSGMLLVHNDDQIVTRAVIGY